MILLNSSQSFYGHSKYLLLVGPDKLWSIITEYIMKVRNREKEEREDKPSSNVNVKTTQHKRKKEAEFCQDLSCNLLETDITVEGSDSSLLV